MGYDLLGYDLWEDPPRLARGGDSRERASARPRRGAAAALASVRAGAVIAQGLGDTARTRTQPRGLGQAGDAECMSVGG